MLLEKYKRISNIHDVASYSGFISGLDGMGEGPQDAFRHGLASALLARELGIAGTVPLAMMNGSELYAAFYNGAESSIADIGNNVVGFHAGMGSGSIDDTVNNVAKAVVYGMLKYPGDFPQPTSESDIDTKTIITFLKERGYGEHMPSDHGGEKPKTPKLPKKGERDDDKSGSAFTHEGNEDTGRGPDILKPEPEKPEPEKPEPEKPEPEKPEPEKPEPEKPEPQRPKVIFYLRPDGDKRQDHEQYSLIAQKPRNMNNVIEIDPLETFTTKIPFWALPTKRQLRKVSDVSILLNPDPFGTFTTKRPKSPLDQLFETPKRTLDDVLNPDPFGTFTDRLPTQSDGSVAEPSRTIYDVLNPDPMGIYTDSRLGKKHWLDRLTLFASSLQSEIAHLISKNKIGSIAQMTDAPALSLWATELLIVKNIEMNFGNRLAEKSNILHRELTIDGQFPTTQMDLFNLLSKVNNISYIGGVALIVDHGQRLKMLSKILEYGRKLN